MKVPGKFWVPCPGIEPRTSSAADKQFDAENRAINKSKSWQEETTGQQQRCQHVTKQDANM